MIDQLMMMSMQLVSELLNRPSLNEFEHQMFEAMCRMIASHCESIRLANELNNIDMEKDLNVRKDYEENEAKNNQE